jgi:hypothetical protein
MFSFIIMAFLSATVPDVPMSYSNLRAVIPTSASRDKRRANRATRRAVASQARKK